MWYDQLLGDNSQHRQYQQHQQHRHRHQRSHYRQLPRFHHHQRHRLGHQLRLCRGILLHLPAQSIALSINGSSTGTTTVTAGTPAIINAVITDTNGNTLNGLQLDYTSTEPQDLGVSPLGQVTATWPGDASINAICQPSTCNPSPIGQIGVFEPALPSSAIPSKSLLPEAAITSGWLQPSRSSSPPSTSPAEPPARPSGPYIPNSMVLDQNGNNLYFGSYRELMIYSAASNALSKEDTTVPGVVLAVSPRLHRRHQRSVAPGHLSLLIHLRDDQQHRRSGHASAFSPDGKNVYIVGPDALYVHNIATGWSTYNSSTTPSGPTQPASNCVLNNNTPGSTGTYDPFAADLAITVPSIGPFITGSPTTAYGFCPNVSNPSVPVYYPQAASLGIQTDQLGATNDGMHILGADATDNELSDISVSIPTGPCPSANTGIKLTPTLNQTHSASPPLKSIRS